MLHSFRHCLPRGSEESPGPQAPLCTRWRTWLGPRLLWAWDPTSPSLLNRACCPGSWHSVLHLEVLLRPPPLPLPSPHPPRRTCFTDMAWSYRTFPVPYTPRTRSQAKPSGVSGSVEKEGRASFGPSRLITSHMLRQLSSSCNSLLHEIGAQGLPWPSYSLPIAGLKPAHEPLGITVRRGSS